MPDIKERIRGALEKADIKINGDRPWDMQVHNEDLYDRILQQGSLGLGEAYMDRWWDVEQLDEFFFRVLRAKIDRDFSINLPMIKEFLISFFTNRQTATKAYEVGEHHYDMGNDLYRAMLDERMVYTCGYWQQADNLDDAQRDKLDLVCRKVGLEEGDRVLDIGCGWGSFAKYAAEEYGAEVVGVTVSRDQVEFGRQLCEGLPVEIRYQDYRDVNQLFDHIISLGMIEHVGRKNYRTFMQVVDRCLADEGVFLLHTIGTNKSTTGTDPWISRYIFPNSNLPAPRDLALAFEKYFVLEDWQNFGPDYDKTLRAWHDNFTHHWEKLKSNYSNRFYRMWTYFLLSCAGSFRAREIQLWQLVLSKKGLSGGFTPPRYRT